ncbi:MAG: phytanoyl-CoA dioxygenase family protein [Gammaproteobacteria bacterium]|nr:phytanoyl-CoA dioxygenase family protein [Gammaproteobacteria bacterium]
MNQRSKVTQAALDMSRAPSAAAAQQAFAEIKALGLEPHVAEIESLGYTVIPPERVGAPKLVPELLRRMCEISKEARGQWPDLQDGTTHADAVDPIERQSFLLAKGRVFEQALMNPVVQAMVAYLLGKDAVLSTCGGRIKGPGALPLMLHTDQTFHPAPLPLVCNATYLLTDYTLENGALCFIPGSHRLQRHPLPEENFHLDGLDRVQAVAAVAQGRQLRIRNPPDLAVVEAPAGSLAVWPGNTWHGAVPRSAPGLRVNLILYFCNKWLRP